MKSIVFTFLSILIFLVSCAPDKKRAANEMTTSQTATAAEVAATMSGDVDCYFSSNVQVQVVDKDGKMEGTFQINTALENVAGTLKGVDYGEDYIADLEYKVGDKTHREKIIINVVANTMNFARSGVVHVDGERMERNGGESTMDELLRKPCK